MTEERKVDLTLTLDEASLIIVGMEAGLINLHSFKATLENIFMDKKTEEQHKELMTKIYDTKRKVVEAYLKATADLVTVKENDDNNRQDQAATS